MGYARSIPAYAGNHSYAAVRAALGRSIPAYAGEPGTQGSRRRQGEVYPRVCGGTDSVANASPLLRGLSPRMRGNLAVATQ